MHRIWNLAAAMAAMLFVAAAPGFDPQPWIDDLAEAKAALSAKYANLEWAVFEREAGLSALFDDTRARIARAGSEAEARAPFDRLIRKIGDEHLTIVWPAAPRAGSAAAPDRCAGYNAAYRTAPLAALMPGYRPLQTPQSDVFPAGLILQNGAEIGVIRVALFMPEGFPKLCRDYVARLPDAPCDDACRDKMSSDLTARMTVMFADQLRALKAAGARVLLVDVTGNGGGSEWAEAVARMLTPVRLSSAPVYFARGEHWVRQFTDIGNDLRDYAKKAGPSERKQLLALAAEADAKRAVAATPCDSAPLWRGEHPVCSWLGKGFYASGVLAAADPKALRGKPWASLLFSPMQFPYEEGVWQGPLIVLVDRDVGSAAVQFTALLQDNRAAVVLGEPTGGGCGHTDGGTPVTLGNSKARLEMPDCARLRPDGSNEVMGVMPDVPVAIAATDGPHRKAARAAAKLPEAAAKALAR